MEETYLLKFRVVQGNYSVCRGIRCQISLCKIELLTICESQGKILGRILYTPSLKLATSPRLRSVQTFIWAFFGEVSHSSLLSFGIMRIKGSRRSILSADFSVNLRSTCRPTIYRHIRQYSADITLSMATSILHSADTLPTPIVITNLS